VGWSQLWSFKQNRWLVYTFNPDNQSGVTAANILIDAAVREEARWTVAAQAAYARHKHNATIYTVGLGNSASIDTPILRQLANQKANDTAFDTTQRKGAYYPATSAAEVAAAFASIARKAGGVLTD